MSPLISIIIATYNAEKTLHDALESVLNQSFQDWECLVVDGASKDNTVKIIEEFCKQDKRFRFISESDKGIYDAFNKGWKMAKGEWIYYLGADDILLKDAFCIFRISTYENCDVLYGKVIYKKFSGLIYKTPVLNLTKLRKFMICSHQAILMKRDVIATMHGFNLKYKVSADYDLMLRCYLQKKKISYIDSDIAVFNCEGTSHENIFKSEGFKIRKDNKSIGILTNYIIQIKTICRFVARKILYLIYKARQK